MPDLSREGPFHPYCAPADTGIPPLTQPHDILRERGGGRHGSGIWLATALSGDAPGIW